MDTPLIANAFRVLSLPADADSKEIYRQQQRLQNALELGGSTAATFYEFLPDLTLGPELLLVAIHRLEKQRLLEELFWIHDLGGKFDLKSKTADTVLVELRTKLDQNTRQGAVAQHNLAVILTFLARELSGLRRFEYWSEALSHWQQTLDGDNFWRFMADRIETIPGASGTTVEDLRNQVKNVLQAAIADELWSAIENKDYAAIRLAIELVLVHQGLLDREVTLKAIAEKLVKDGFVAIGGVFDRIAEIAKAGDPFIIRNALTASEHEILRISNAFSETFQALGPAVASAGWDDARAKAYEQLSVAYFNLLHDAPAALRLLVEGQKLAHNVELKTRLGDGWKYIQRDIFCAEGLEMMRSGDIIAAEQKFADALSLSTPEQKPEVEQLLENCGARAVGKRIVERVFEGSTQNPSLRTLTGICTALYGKRDFDSKSDTYVATQWFVLLFLPIFPIAAYRVRSAGKGSYYVYGRGPLSSSLKTFKQCILLAAMVLLLGWLFRR